MLVLVPRLKLFYLLHGCSPETLPIFALSRTISLVVCFSSLLSNNKVRLKYKLDLGKSFRKKRKKTESGILCSAELMFPLYDNFRWHEQLTVYIKLHL